MARTASSSNSLNVQIKKVQVAIAEQNDTIQAAKDKQSANRELLASLNAQKQKRNGKK